MKLVVSAVALLGFPISILPLSVKSFGSSLPPGVVDDFLQETEKIIAAKMIMLDNLFMARCDFRLRQLQINGNNCLMYKTLAQYLKGYKLEIV